MNLRSYFTETNAAMRRVLRTLRASRAAAVIGPLDLLAAPTLDELVEVAGSVFLRSCAPYGETFVRGSYLVNRSCWEQWHNRVELYRGISARNSGPELVKHGIAIAEILKLKLRAAYPRRRFRVHVSWNSSSLFESRRSYEGTRKCTVSFWQIRRGEQVYGPLEAYKFDAIGEVTVGPARG